MLSHIKKGVNKFRKLAKVVKAKTKEINAVTQPLFFNHQKRSRVLGFSISSRCQSVGTAEGGFAGGGACSSRIGSRYQSSFAKSSTKAHIFTARFFQCYSRRVEKRTRTKVRMSFYHVYSCLVSQMQMLLKWRIGSRTSTEGSGKNEKKNFSYWASSTP